MALETLEHRVDIFLHCFAGSGVVTRKSKVIFIAFLTSVLFNAISVACALLRSYSNDVAGVAVSAAFAPPSADDGSMRK